MIYSLKTRIAVWYISLTIAILIGCGVTIFYSLSHTLYKQSEQQLRGDIEYIRNFAQEHTNWQEEDFLTELHEQFALKLQNEFIDISKSGGISLYLSRNLKGHRLPLASGLATRTTPRIEKAEGFDKQPLLITATMVTVNNEENLIVIAVSLSSVKQIERILILILLLSIPISILMALLGSFLLARRAIEPVDRIAHTARRITTQNLSERINLSHADIELQQLTEAFNDMIARLENGFQQMRQFTADASHELRTPLAILKGGAELTLNGDLNSDDCKQIMKSQLEELEHMTKIVEDLLVLSRFDAGENKLDIQRVDLTDLVIETCEQMRRHVEANQLSLMIEAIQPIEIEGDELRLRQMVRNLLDNAIKYTQRGGQVQISLEPQGKFSRLTIADTGIGIPASHLPRIFDRFYRADKARSREMGGSGLGLSIVKKIVEAHGGSIEIASELSKGTSIFILLPSTDYLTESRTTNKMKL